MNFKEKFYKNIVPELQKELKLKNRLAIPRVSKINVTVGIGGMYNQNKDFSFVVNHIAQITGQHGITTKAKKAISNFKLRKGMPSGVGVTLHGKRLYDFLNKLVNVIFPRIRDFRGLSLKSFDGKGNYSIGIKEFSVFPEIKIDDVVKNHGIQITIVTTAKDNQTGYTLLKALGFPFKKEALPSSK